MKRERRLEEWLRRKAQRIMHEMSNHRHADGGGSATDDPHARLDLSAQEPAAPEQRQHDGTLNHRISRRIYEPIEATISGREGIDSLRDRAVKDVNVETQERNYRERTKQREGNCQAPKGRDQSCHSAASA